VSTVVDNSTPSIDSGCDDISIQAFTSGTLTLIVSDENTNDRIAITDISYGSLTPAWITSSELTIIFAPTANSQVGSYTIQATVSDNNSISGANGV